ncbi:hypothetical protein Tco_0910046 [Tanacetum coccineum]|uniref:Uncharacterized protein n=1 Tax=Tanacetum coccineum TaxID=301880 RepID=A0ABQ5CRT1_9ASTR
MQRFMRSQSPEESSSTVSHWNKKDDSNVTPDSSNICTNDNQVDQNVVECVDERAALANLIANLTLDTEENKTILKQLKKANASLTQELEKCKTNLDETNSALGEAIRLLALKDIEIKEGLKTKAYEISVLNQKHDELVKKSLLTRSQLEGYLKENTKVISDLKVKEEKDIDKMIENGQTNLPQNIKQAEIHSNVLKPGMYRISTTTTQNREPQLPHASRNTNPHVSKSSGVNHTQVRADPQLKYMNDVNARTRKPNVVPIRVVNEEYKSGMKWRIAKNCPSEIHGHKSTLDQRIWMPKTGKPICPNVPSSFNSLAELYTSSYIIVELWNYKAHDGLTLSYINVQGSTFVLCEISKAKRSSFKSKVFQVPKEGWKMLTMDLVGPMRIESIHIKFDEIKEMMSDHTSSDLAPQRQEMSVENVSSGLVPQGQKASDYDNSDPVPPRQNVVPTAEKTDSSQQSLVITCKLDVKKNRLHCNALSASLCSSNWTRTPLQDLWLQLQQNTVVLGSLSPVQSNLMQPRQIHGQSTSIRGLTSIKEQDRFKYLVRRIGMRCLTLAELEVLTNETA